MKTDHLKKNTWKNTNQKEWIS